MFLKFGFSKHKTIENKNFNTRNDCGALETRNFKAIMSDF